MTEIYGKDEGEVSLVAILTIIVRKRLMIAAWMLTAGSMAAIGALMVKRVYMASASFVSQTAGTDRSGLTTLAGQFGITVPGTGQTSSPDFYIWLLKSRVLSETIVRDTFEVSELGGRRVPVLDLLEIAPGPQVVREESAIAVLGELVKAESRKTTGVIRVTAASPLPSVSLSIIKGLVDGVNKYNRETRQGQAAEERKFTGARLLATATELRQAEDTLQRFLSNNREMSPSAALNFDRDRLQRAVMLKQQVYTTLSQSYEDVRIREVRDIPVITVIEPPSVGSGPEPRGRLKRIFLGLVIGASLGLLAVLFSERVHRLRKQRDEDVDELFASLRELRSSYARIFRVANRTATPSNDDHIT